LIDLIFIDFTMLSNYEFGRININGKNYTSDLIVSRGKVIPNWWREEGHLLQLPDIEDILNFKPEVLVVGTGFNGIMKVDESLREYCKNRKIILAEFTTGKAVDYYNKLNDKEKTVLAIHLTC